MREEVYTKEICGRWLVDGHLVYQLEEYHDERTGQLRKRNRVWFSVNGQGQTDELAEQIAIDLNSHAALVEALEPFANFFEKFSAKPLRGIGDEFYGIHTGTEWAASLLLSDMKRAAEALAAAKVTR